MKWYEIIESDERWDSKTGKWILPEPPQMQTVIVNGVKRPLYNSNNKVIAPTTDEIVAFWDWFGRSKTTDEFGRPLVVYRGDKLGKTDFTGRENKSNYIQGNIFFSSEKNIAKGYTNHRGSSYLASSDMNQSHGLYSVYLKIEKPLVIDAKEAEWDRIPLSGRFKKEVGSDFIQIDDLALYVQQNTKNDGLIAKNVWDQFGDGHQFVVFSNQQIKILQEG